MFLQWKCAQDQKESFGPVDSGKLTSDYLNTAGMKSDQETNDGKERMTKLLQKDWIFPPFSGFRPENCHRISSTEIRD